MIKVGYCVAYDWELLRYSIPQIYDYSDFICLSIDKERKSWSGESFTWNEDGFRNMLSELDTKKKIHVYEDYFYKPDLLPMQNEVAQRNKIAQFLGEGGWHIQLDADEYFFNFKDFVQYLNNFKSNRKVNICCPLINLYKQLPDGFLWIKPNRFSKVEFIQIATQVPLYEHGRKNGYFNILTDFSILHQSWARKEEEIWEKLNNWGHKLDFDIDKYFKVWKKADKLNFHTYKNFHHLKPEAWPSLDFVQNKNIEDLMKTGSWNFPLPIEKRKLFLENSIWYSRMKKLIKLTSSKKENLKSK